jgi:hypothetical protein
MGGPPLQEVAIMTSLATQEPQSPPRKRNRGLIIGLVIAGVALLGVAAVIVLGVLAFNRSVPQFASLTATPDTSLHGTVAYLDDQSNCVRVISMSGAHSKTIYCIPAQDVKTNLKLGKELGPQLVWRDGANLEITMFRMTDPPGPNFNPGWQKVVNVQTGQVTDTPAALVPTKPDLMTRPTINAMGDKLVATSDRSSGKISTLLETATQTRELLKAQGPGQYTYGLNSVFWAPDDLTVMADDGRILVITTADPPVTRVLTDASTNVAFGGDDQNMSRFAVTSTDYLTGS